MEMHTSKEAEMSKNVSKLTYDPSPFTINATCHVCDLLMRLFNFYFSVNPYLHSFFLPPPNFSLRNSLKWLGSTRGHPTNRHPSPSADANSNSLALLMNGPTLGNKSGLTLTSMATSFSSWCHSGMAMAVTWWCITSLRPCFFQWNASGQILVSKLFCPECKLCVIKAKLLTGLRWEVLNLLIKFSYRRRGRFASEKEFTRLSNI